MPSGDTKMFHEDQKSDKTPFIICAYVECLIERIKGCKGNPEKPSITKVSEHTSSGFSMPKIYPFKSIKNNNDIRRDKDCMNNFCETLREHIMDMINFVKENLNFLTKKQQKLYENAKVCDICKEKFENKYAKDKNYYKVRGHCHYTRKYRGAAQM